jgi:hypothetical protein
MSSAIIFSYLFGRSGRPILPFAVLLLALLSGGTAALLLRRHIAASRDIAPLLAIIGCVFVALLWAAWPQLLPRGGGSDLAHHLQLIDFIDRQRMLSREADVTALIGGMVNYTPGSHLLASLVGAWTGRDGLHALYFVLALVSALKAGIVFLVVRRLPLDPALSGPAAIGAVLVLFVPYDYFLGSFERASFFAQAIAELFAVGMWWALVVWDERPSVAPMLLCALFGMTVVLTWPVWIGPPCLVLLILFAARRDVGFSTRLAHSTVALVPVALIAGAHAYGRADAVAILQTGGSAFRPTLSRLGWPFVLLGSTGILLAAGNRVFRVTTLLLAAIALQAVGLLVVARSGGAESPYLALKMMHFAIYPLAALSAVALAAAVRRSTSRLDAALTGRTGWGLVGAAAIATTASFAAVDRPAPPITEEVFRAGQWARDHVPVACVEYLVPKDATSYWLHLAVLRNGMQPPRGAAPPAFDFTDAIVRWLTNRSHPFAIADLSVTPREVREQIDVLAQFGAIVVGRRRGAADGCGDGYAIGSATILPSKR